MRLAAAVPVILLASIATSAPAVGQPVDLDCTKKSLAKALEKAGDTLEINISGLCVEDIVIRRDRVTLRGVTPDAGIASPAGSTTTATVWVIDSQNVLLETLSIGPSTSRGVQAFSSSVTINNSEIHDTGQDGLQSVAGAVLRLNNTTIRDSGRAGLSSWFGSDISCTNCTIEHTSPTSPTGAARWAGYAIGGRLVFVNSSATGGRFGLGGYDSGTVYVTDSDVHASQWAYLSDQNGQVWVSGTGAPVEFSGGVASEGGGMMVLDNATQLTGPTYGNVAFRGGFLHVTGGTSLIDPVYPEHLGKVIVDGTSSLASWVECWMGGDLVCQDPSFIAGHIDGCASCVAAPPALRSRSTTARGQGPRERPRPELVP